MEVDLGPDHIVLNGDPAPQPLKAGQLTFRPMSIVAKRLDGSRCHLVRNVASVQAILYYSPQFSAHICCGHTGGWIKMPLGTKHRPRPRPHCVT